MGVGKVRCLRSRGSDWCSVDILAFARRTLSGNLADPIVMEHTSPCGRRNYDFASCNDRKSFGCARIRIRARHDRDERTPLHMWQTATIVVARAHNSVCSVDGP